MQRLLFGVQAKSHKQAETKVDTKSSRTPPKDARLSRARQNISHSSVHASGHGIQGRDAKDSRRTKTSSTFTKDPLRSKSKKAHVSGQENSQSNFPDFDGQVTLTAMVDDPEGNIQESNLTKAENRSNTHLDDSEISTDTNGGVEDPPPSTDESVPVDNPPDEPHVEVGNVDEGDSLGGPTSGASSTLKRKPRKKLTGR